MSGLESIESFLIRGEVAYEQLDPSTWVIALDDERRNRIFVHIEAPIALFSTTVLELGDQIQDRERLFRTLLELNSQFLHCAYGIDGNRVVLSGAQQLENLDWNEFQAVLDDMSMALDTQKEALQQWAKRE